MPITRAHPNFIIPPSETTIWKYMQFSKFVSLLLSKSLYFSRCDKFEDPWEGKFPLRTFEKGLLIDRLQEVGVDPSTAEKSADAYIKVRPSLDPRHQVAASCWHINQIESDAFWKIYSRMDEGIAIKSTVGSLMDALDCQTNRHVHISEVKYKDYNKEYVPLDNLLTAAITKRLPFRHEQELRVFIWEPEGTSGAKGGPFGSDFGESIPVELEVLITQVIVSPLSSIWFFNDVAALIKRLGFNFECVRSNLLQAPNF